MPDLDDLTYDFRTMAERVNARMKDKFGARFLRVRGALKVKCHLMLGIVALAVDQIIRVVDDRTAPAGQGRSVLRSVTGDLGFPRAEMSESIRDNPNRRLSHAGVAIGDFALDPRPSSRGRQAARFGDGMAAGANSCRQMHEFIRIHLQRLNGAFGLRLPYSPSYTGLRLIIQGVDPAALEAAFRQHASSISAPIPSDGLSAIAVDGKTLRGSFDAFSDRKAAHMMSALRQADQIVLGHLMVAEKSNEIPAAPELIEALGLKGCVFTLDAEHAQKIVRARDRLGQSPADPGQG